VHPQPVLVEVVRCERIAGKVVEALVGCPVDVDRKILLRDDAESSTRLIGQRLASHA
jgi:glutaredoxin 2